MEERVALPRRMCFAIGLPRGFLQSVQLPAKQRKMEASKNHAFCCVI